MTGPPLPEGCSELLRDFLTQCFDKDPAQRPDALSLSQHPWLTQAWAPIAKDLRPIDSIPFFRRVSADIQKSDAMRLLSQLDMPESERSTPDFRPRLDSFMSGTPPRPRLSIDPDSVSISPRDHSFVKTSFSRPVVCKVCMSNVKKSAVLCELCSLIAHSKCIPNAPPTCDLRSQLLSYAQYAENGGSANNVYPSPNEILAAVQSAVPTSPTSDGGFSSRPSLDIPSTPVPPTPSGPHPPTAFKVFAAFKRSMSSLNTQESDITSASASSSHTTSNQRAISHKRSVLRRNPASGERPISIASSSTHAHSSSVRSAATTSDSISTRRETTVRQSTISIAETNGSIAERSDPRLSKMTSYSVVSTVGTELGERQSVALPGHLPRDQRSGKRDKESKSSSGGCIVQ